MSQPDTPSTPPASTAQPGFEVLDAAHLDARLNAVRDALRMCPTEVPASLSIPAHKALDAVAQRLALGVDHTVIALAGRRLLLGRRCRPAPGLPRGLLRTADQKGLDP